MAYVVSMSLQVLVHAVATDGSLDWMGVRMHRFIAPLWLDKCKGRHVYECARVVRVTMANLGHTFSSTMIVVVVAVELKGNGGDGDEATLHA